MIYRFLMLSPEEEDFMREFKISSDATFLDFHDIIVESVNYDGKEMSSFFMCNEDWSQETEVTLVDMGSSSDEDTFLMKDTPLSEFLEEEKQKLIFVYDYMTERSFFMELREIIFGEDLERPLITKSIGQAPPQFIDFNEEIITTSTSSSIIDDDFYGNEFYDLDELDADGFDGLDNNETTSLDNLEGY